MFFSLYVFLSLCFSLFITFHSVSLNFFIDLFTLFNINLSVSFNLDFMSSWFCTVVLFISIVIFFYSYFYMSPYSNSPYFLWLTFLFVASMLLVITMSSLFFVMLGWDGLGLISFFLIVYYQNSSSIFSGLNTVLINRMGDCFFVCSIVCFIFFYPDLFSFSSSLLSHFIIFLLGFTFMTNSAIFPFSPWLPLAIAAPTPISALVHSSTLVTSGLFLMMRFSYLFYSSYYFMVFFMIFTVYTSFYAGFNTLFENDLNKLIALSTLSHLGFIGMSFSIGCLYLSFFHLLVHALFNSLLFITIGDIIINLSHSQDIRYLSSGFSYTPFSSSIMYVSLVNLAGLPSLSGFFSNDLILEFVNYSNSGLFIYIFVVVNLFFTFYYTFQLFYYTFQLNKLSPYLLVHSPYNLHAFLIFVLSLFTVSFGSFFLTNICFQTIFVVVPFLINFLPIIILFIFLLYVLFNLSITFNSSPFTTYLGSSILFLSFFTSSLSSQSFLSLSGNLFNSLETGALYYTFNSSPFNLITSISNTLYSFTLLNPLFIALISFPFIFLIIF